MKEDARNMNDQPDRFELFTLEDGEEKYVTISIHPSIPPVAFLSRYSNKHCRVTMEYDSRKPSAPFSSISITHFIYFIRLTCLRYPQHSHLLFCPRRPHPRKPPRGSPSTIRACPLRCLQSSAPALPTLHLACVDLLRDGPS